jgi:hypothetical protein
MRIRTRFVLAVAIAVAGCGSRTLAAKSPTSSAHRGTPYRLYTHCGIEWARIDGTYWRAIPPLSDGSGNPPGWGNPFQEGTLSRTRGATAEFNSPAGSVTFHRTNRTRPPLICS